MIIIISPANNSRMNDCIIELHNCMTINYIYLNTNKTTLINITNKIYHFPTIYFENIALIPHNSTTYLGVIFTSNLTMTAHINNITKTATTHLIQLYKIRKSLPSKKGLLTS